MRILTIRQPWVGLIMRGSKCIENRSWSTKYTGPLLIHAAARQATDERARLARDNCIVDENDPAWSVGAIVGIVELHDCVSDHPSKWADPGAWHWVLKQKRVFSDPVPAKGRLGLWSLDALDKRTIRKVESQI